MKVSLHLLRPTGVERDFNELSLIRCHDAFQHKLPQDQLLDGPLALRRFEQCLNVLAHLGQGKKPEKLVFGSGFGGSQLDFSVQDKHFQFGEHVLHTGKLLFQVSLPLSHILKY